MRTSNAKHDHQRVRPSRAAPRIDRARQVRIDTLCTHVHTEATISRVHVVFKQSMRARQVRRTQQRPAPFWKKSQRSGSIHDILLICRILSASNPHLNYYFTPTSHFACTSPPSQQRSPHPHAYSVRPREKREHSSLSLCSRASPRVYMCALGKFIPYYCCAFSFFTCMLPLLWNRAVASLFFSPRADAPSLVPQKAPRKARARNFCFISSRTF